MLQRAWLAAEQVQPRLSAKSLMTNSFSNQLAAKISCHFYEWQPSSGGGFHSFFIPNHGSPCYHLVTAEHGSEPEGSA